MSSVRLRLIQIPQISQTKKYRSRRIGRVALHVAARVAVFCLALFSLSRIISDRFLAIKCSRSACRANFCRVNSTLSSILNYELEVVLHRPLQTISISRLSADSTAAHCLFPVWLPIVVAAYTVTAGLTIEAKAHKQQLMQ